MLPSESSAVSAARFIDRAEALNDSIEGASLNVGLVRGGSARNTVPDRASADIELRFSDAAGESALLQALDKVAREVEAGSDGVKLELRTVVARKPWARSAESSALAARYGSAQLAAGLLFSEAPVMGGGSDANTAGALGLPAIDGLGPRGKGFHTHDEYIEVASLPLKAEAPLRFLLSECQVG